MPDASEVLSGSRRGNIVVSFMNRRKREELEERTEDKLEMLLKKKKMADRVMRITKNFKER